MKFKKFLLTFIISLFTLTFYSQNTTITIDVSELRTGEISRNFVYLSTITSTPIEDKEAITLQVDHFPTLLSLSTRKKNRSYLQKLIWVNSTSISIKGNLEDINSLNVYPEGEEQQIADQLFGTISKNKEAHGSLAITRPYLAHLAYKKNFKKPQHLSEVLSKTPESMGDFWAVMMLKKYLKDIQNIGYNAKEKTISTLTAINKEGKEVNYQRKEGQYLLLDFSASWCVPCLNDIDKIAALHAKNSDKLDIVMLWNDKSFDYWKNAAKDQKAKITWNSFLDKNGSSFKAMDIKVFPTYILFNKEGKKIKTWKGSLPTNIDKYLL